MKKLLTLALILSSATAFATRSRTIALGNAAHVVDVNTVYTQPADMMSLGDSVTIETGTTATAYTTVGAGATATNSSDSSKGAEGIMIRSFGDSKFALSLGHDDVGVFNARANANLLGVVSAITYAPKTQQNPLGLYYGMKAGDIALAGGLQYSNYNDKKNSEKESYMGLTFGAKHSMWDASLMLDLVNTWENGTAAGGNDNFKGKTAINLNGGYNLTPEMYLHGTFNMGGFKAQDANADKFDVESQVISVGVVDSIRKDGSEVFWGADLATTTMKEKISDSKTTALSLPLIVGMEVDAATWLTLRGSVTQTVLLNDSKTDTAGATSVELSPGLNTTKLAAGAGLKFNKITLDGSLLAGGSQTINGSANGLLGTVGLTYVF